MNKWPSYLTSVANSINCLFAASETPAEELIILFTVTWACLSKNKLHGCLFSINLVPEILVEAFSTELRQPWITWENFIVKLEWMLVRFILRCMSQDSRFLLLLLKQEGPREMQVSLKTTEAFYLGPLLLSNEKFELNFQKKNSKETIC